MSTDSVFARMNHRIHDVTGRLEWLPPVTIRIALGITFILSGWGKLHHLAQVEQYFASLHIPAPGIQAPFVATVELVGGVLVLLGLATRYASLLLTGVMAVAIYTAIWPDAASWTDVVGSLEVIYLLAFVQLVVKGGGAASLDHVIVRLVPALQLEGTTAAPAAT